MRKHDGEGKLYDLVNKQSINPRRKDMIKHVVMWRFKQENKEANMQKAKELLLALPAMISEIKKMDVYFDALGKDGAMDVILEVELEDAEALGIYAVHPEHLKVVEFIKSVVESRVVLDAEI